MNDEYEKSHFFYGGTEGVVDLMVENLVQAYPNINISGYLTPPLGHISENELYSVKERVINSGTSILWIGLGTPKQDYLVDWFTKNTNLVTIPIGAVFDFSSGKVAEAPEFFRASGFEWLYRLMQEPRRLWRRYTLNSMHFVYLYLRNFLQK